MNWLKSFPVNGVDVEVVRIDGLPSGIPWVDATTAYRAAGHDLDAACSYAVDLMIHHSDWVRLSPDGLPIIPPSEARAVVERAMAEQLCPPDTMDMMAIGFALVVEQFGADDPEFGAWLDAHKALIAATPEGRA